MCESHRSIFLARLRTVSSYLHIWIRRSSIDVAVLDSFTEIDVDVGSTMPLHGEWGDTWNSGITFIFGNIHITTGTDFQSVALGLALPLLPGISSNGNRWMTGDYLQRWSVLSQRLSHTVSASDSTCVHPSRFWQNLKMPMRTVIFSILRLCGLLYITRYSRILLGKGISVKSLSTVRK